MHLEAFITEADVFLSLWERIDDKSSVSFGAKGTRYRVTTDDEDSAREILSIIVFCPGCEVILRTKAAE